MPLKTKRWDDPADPDDGERILVCRYRPRGLRKESETWDAWRKELAPSAALLSDFHGGLDWDAYRRRYLDEMEAQEFWLRALADRVAAGERITLLCSSACTDPARCHRTLLAGLVEDRLPGASGALNRGTRGSRG